VSCLAAFATTIIEFNICNYANNKVPESLDYPCDKKREKSDLDSVGVFQQRAKYYHVDEAMDPAKSAHLFFKRMNGVDGWEKAKNSKQVGALCQKVQGTSWTNDRCCVIRPYLTVTQRTWTRRPRSARRPRSLDDCVSQQDQLRRK
jgi:hypothetical protein